MITLKRPREIALMLGISVSTVETHLARGMQQLMHWRRRTAQTPIGQPPAISADDTAEAGARQA